MLVLTEHFMTQILFEMSQVPAMYVAIQMVLALLYFGTHDGHRHASLHDAGHVRDVRRPSHVRGP